MSGRDEEFAIPDPAALLGEAAAGEESAAAGTDAAAPAMAVLSRHHDSLMALEGVVMVGVGQNEIGDPAIVVGVKRADQLKSIPATLEGVAVRPQVVGEVDAYAGGGKPRKK